MTSLWWWALPVLLLPLWWHRQRRRQVQATPLATARFLPKSAPRQLRAWRWVDIVLLLLRCLLLGSAIAWLADPVIAWRGDTVLTAKGDAIGWFQAREAEWKPDAKIVVTGPQTMAASMPRLRHAITLRTTVPAMPTSVRHVAIVSANPAPWRALLAAIDGPAHYVIDAAPGAGTRVFAPAGPAPRDAATARALFESWERAHYAPAPYVAPAQVLAADPSAPMHSPGGALRDVLLLAVIVLFALERGLAHGSKR